MIQIYSKFISNLFCLPKSHQLQYALNKEYEIWRVLISYHHYPIITKTPPINSYRQWESQTSKQKKRIFIITVHQVSFHHVCLISLPVHCNLSLSISPLSCQYDNDNFIYNSRSTSLAHLIQHWYDDVIKPVVTQQILKFKTVPHQP